MYNYARRATAVQSMSLRSLAGSRARAAQVAPWHGRRRPSRPCGCSGVPALIIFSPSVVSSMPRGPSWTSKYCARKKQTVRASTTCPWRPYTCRPPHPRQLLGTPRRRKPCGHARRPPPDCQAHHYPAAGHRAAQQNPAGQPAGGRVSKTSHPMTWGHCGAQAGLRRASGAGAAWRSLELEACSHSRRRPLQRARKNAPRTRGPSAAVPRRSPKAGRRPLPLSGAELTSSSCCPEERARGRASRRPWALHVLADLQHVQRRGRGW